MNYLNKILDTVAWAIRKSIIPVILFIILIITLYTIVVVYKDIGNVLFWFTGTGLLILWAFCRDSV